MQPQEPRRTAEYRLGETIFRVIYADITTVHADALISSDDNHLSMGGGVSDDLLSAGGPEIRRDARKHLPLKIGDVVVTTAGALHAKYIFHCALIDLDRHVFPDTDDVATVTRRCLQLADNFGLRHIVFPALGTGVGGFPFDKCADVMTRTVSEHLAQDTTLEVVTVALKARESVTQSDLNIFWEKAVGLASLWTQSKQLQSSLTLLEGLIASSGRDDLQDAFNALRLELDNAKDVLAQNPSTSNHIEELRKKSNLEALGKRVTEVSEVTRSSVDWEDRQTEAKALRTRLEGLNTQLNVHYASLNTLEIEQAKFAGVGVPVILQNQIVAVKDDIDRVEKLRQQTQKQLATLSARKGSATSY
jgi:O-acetyl-ADP-ribose deacetylase (regulator of RNase III)